MSNDNIAPFIIRIQTALEKEGIKGAQKELQAMQQETDKAEKSTAKMSDTTKKSGEASVNAGQGFAALGQAAATSSGGIGSMASALGGLTQQMPALEAIAGPIGLAVAAITALKVAIDQYYEAQDKDREMVAGIQADNQMAGLDRVKQAYDDVVQKINEAADAAQKFYDAEASRDDAETKRALARLDLEFEKKRAALDPEDPLAERRLNAEKAGRRADIMDAAENRRNQRELDRLRAQAATEEDMKSASLDRISVIEDKINRFSQQAQSTRLSARDAAENIAWWQGGEWRRNKIIESGTRIATPLENKITELVAELRQKNAQVSASDRNLFSLAERAGAVLINQRETTPIRQETAQVQRSITRRGIEQDARQQKVEKVTKVKEDTGYQEAQKNTDDIYKKFKAARREQNNRLALEFLREWRAAKAEENRLWRTLSSEQKAHGQAIKNLQQQSRRAGSGG